MGHRSCKVCCSFEMEMEFSCLRCDLFINLFSDRPFPVPWAPFKFLKWRWVVLICHLGRVHVTSCIEIAHYTVSQSTCTWERKLVHFLAQRSEMPRGVQIRLTAGVLQKDMNFLGLSYNEHCAHYCLRSLPACQDSLTYCLTTANRLTIFILFSSNYWSSAPLYCSYLYSIFHFKARVHSLSHNGWTRAGKLKQGCCPSTPFSSVLVWNWYKSCFLWLWLNE